MKLREWLFRKKMSQVQLAALLGTTPAYLNHVLTGKKEFSKRMAKAVEILTEGKVTADELLFPEKYPEEDEA